MRGKGKAGNLKIAARLRKIRASGSSSPGRSTTLRRPSSDKAWETLA
jgi:hypothetical protein